MLNVLQVRQNLLRVNVKNQMLCGSFFKRVSVLKICEEIHFNWVRPANSNSFKILGTVFSPDWHSMVSLDNNKVKKNLIVR